MNAKDLALRVAMVACLAGPASATVTVSYDGDPDLYVDTSDRGSDPRDVVMSLAAHLRELGDRYIPPSDDLRIKILDVDRAGTPRPNLPTGFRVMRGDSDFPCIELDFRLSSGASSVQSAHERVCDRNYLRRTDRPGLRYSSHDPLVYDKIMLDDWFRVRFGARHSTSD